MALLDQNYLLESESAKRLYKEIEELAILDPHNHGDVKEILDNEAWNDIWEVEAATDHYVWELMRKRGVPEEKITGDASNKEKWMALAEVFPEFAGNPTYEWIHLDLKRQFGIEESISKDTAELIWDKTKEILAQADMRPQSLLKKMNVEIMCTTDEPYSLLEEHKRAKEEVDGVKILPTWRPDKIMNIEADNWLEYVEKLTKAYNESKIEQLDDLLTALKNSHDYFAEMGCIASDHGILEPISYRVEKGRAAEIYQKGLKNKELSKKDIKDFKAFMLAEFAKLNQEKDWVTQLHIGAVRNYRESLYEKLGPDTGGDISNYSIEIVDNLKYFINQFGEDLNIVLYTMDPVHWFTVSTISRAFPKVSLGAPWWLNDTPYGMETQLKQVTTVDLFYNLAGMVTDSRKLMSYSSRTEMFRRTLANVVGKMVDKGQMPYSVAADLVNHVCYEGQYNLFFK
ncbi:glucuronate isomerase [Halanaerobium hydrogeniformans]|uniref:Uronate isomerase n=1 Tax=Halanaerobium hydrogeniformans TaxID=656519 RepID=E4RPZ1_HALHG|nr:glucuronate isomerase [Halanaerobium hydrogeniformans]ADQ14358.1 Glucuronate isomerase [Halanaerobium hydrogeniformans]